jgi:tRNA 2-selenouridine synthase
MQFAQRKVGVEEIARFADRLDVRSPAEFALDHLPRAQSAPVLDDAERAAIGTLHAKVSGFAARKAGAAIVARNIATIIDTIAADKPLGWAPLIYCWRGGQRSRSLAHVLGEIGFGAMQLDGGYRAWRRHVVAQLDVLPPRLRLVVVCGLTGSGKSRLVQALAAAGAQALDLEALARHRGSLLGDEPGNPQPSQRHFETGIFDVLSGFALDKPIFVESESKRIGKLQVPEALLAAMRRAHCIRVDTGLPLRVRLLLDDYPHWCLDAGALNARLAPLAVLHGKATISRWQEAATRGEFGELVAELLALHYDPSYSRSIERNFTHMADAPAIAPQGADRESFSVLAREAISIADNFITSGH